MKSPGTPLCGGMAGGGPADLARAPSVPPNISKKSGSQSHKNWRFNFQVNHFVGFCCFFIPFKKLIYSVLMLHHARSIGTYITCGTSFCRIWCPSCWGDFRRSMKRPCVREKSQRTETSMIDDQNLFLTKTDEKNKHAFNDLPILAAQMHFPIHLPYEVIPNITCLLVQSPTRIHGLI